IAVAGGIGHSQPRLLDAISAIAEVGLGGPSHREQSDVMARLAMVDHGLFGQTDHVGGVGAGQAPVRRHDHDADRLHGALLQQHVRGAASVGATHVLDHLDQLGCVRLGGVDAGRRFGDTGGGNQFHGASDLLDRLDAADPAPGVPKGGTRHRSSALLALVGEDVDVALDRLPEPVVVADAAGVPNGVEDVPEAAPYVFPEAQFEALNVTYVDLVHESLGDGVYDEHLLLHRHRLVLGL